jgi:hypothetical protein
MGFGELDMLVPAYGHRSSRRSRPRWGNIVDVADITVDAVGRSRRPCAQEPRLELLAVGAVVDPFSEAVIHSPAEMFATWPTTVATSLDDAR